MNRDDSNLETAVARFIAVARSAFQPILDRRPWTDIAVNPTPLFREAVNRLEDGPAFRGLVEEFNAWAFEQGLSPQRPAALDDSEPPPQWWKVSSFLRNCWLYDNLIAGVDVCAGTVAAELQREAARTDVLHKDIAYLENLRCVEPVVVPGAFSIRHLTDDEVDHHFCGFSHLDRIETRQAMKQALEAEWFAVVEHPAKPLSMHLSIPGAIGLHDFRSSPLPDINLALNLFKPAAGPIVIRQTYHFQTTLFDRARAARPKYSDDLHPGSWGGSPEPPRLCYYDLTTADARRLPKFWNTLQDVFFAHRKYFPKYLHRGINRFLRACGWNRADWEFRQLLYVMALEALYNPGDEDRPAVFNSSGEAATLKIRKTIARCCANLVAGDRQTIMSLNQWLWDLYEQRSAIAHGKTFEQELFHSQPQDPDEHVEAGKLAGALGFDGRCVWDGPDIEFAVLHNVVRESIVMFIEHAAAVLSEPKVAAARRAREELPTGSSPTTAERERRRELDVTIQDAHENSHRQFLQQAHDAFRRGESARLSLRASVRRLLGVR
jgi:hypothetical protein